MNNKQNNKIRAIHSYEHTHQAMVSLAGLSGNRTIPFTLSSLTLGLSWLMLLGLSGCASLPHEQKPPVLQTPQKSALIAVTPQGTWPHAAWWKQLDNAQLNTLINLALAHSPTLEIARARIEQATASAQIIAAGTGTSLSANASITRQRYTENSFYPPPLGGAYRNDGELSLNATKSFDWWARNKSALEAGLGRVNAAQAEHAGAASLLAATITQNYIRWQSLNARLNTSHNIQQDYAHQLHLEQQRVHAGLAAPETLESLKAATAAAQQQCVQLQTQQSQVLFQLKTLVDASDDFPALHAQPLSSLHIQSGLPPAASLDLIARRADITAAKDRVIASLKDVQSARAAFYPDISISAFAGLSSLELGTLLHSGSRILGLEPALHLPIFDAGRLRALLASQHAEVTLAIGEYDQAIQNAVGEINNAVIAIHGSEKESTELQTQYKARQRSLHTMTLRAQAGLNDKRDVIQAHLAVLLLEGQRQLLEENTLIAHIELIKALGGGFHEPSTTITDHNPASGVHHGRDTINNR